MRIFISHATKNMQIVRMFAEFLESVSNEIEVFCSCDDGSITAGKNFIKMIFAELNSSDLFIPILTKEYYESRFCMIELGVAYSYLLQKYEKDEEEYIIPFAVSPVTRGEALYGTPLEHIQVGEMGNESDIRSLLDHLSSERKLHIGTGVNRKLHSFQIALNQKLLKNQNIMKIARIGTFLGESIDYKCKEDVVAHSFKNNAIVVNYNMNIYEDRNMRYLHFISMVLRYPDKIDLGSYLNFNNSAKFKFVLMNDTNSINKIFVEFKYSDNNRPLETFQLPIRSGENKLCIPLEEMRGKALRQISEICFVIHPEDVNEKEGKFQIGEIEIA